MNNSRLAQKDLESLIDRYFEAQTSESEEVLLKNYLAHGRYRLTPDVVDALAVMSLSASAASKRHRRRTLASLVSIGASLAIVTTAALHMHTDNNHGVCEMYIAGVQVSGSEWVSDKIQSDLKIVSEASETANDVVGVEARRIYGPSCAGQCQTLKTLHMMKRIAVLLALMGIVTAAYAVRPLHILKALDGTYRKADYAIETIVTGQAVKPYGLTRYHSLSVTDSAAIADAASDESGYEQCYQSGGWHAQW